MYTSEIKQEEDKCFLPWLQEVEHAPLINPESVFRLK